MPFGNRFRSKEFFVDRGFELFAHKKNSFLYPPPAGGAGTLRKVIYRRLPSQFILGLLINNYLINKILAQLSHFVNADMQRDPSAFSQILLNEYLKACREYQYPPGLRLSICRLHLLANTDV